MPFFLAVSSNVLVTPLSGTVIIGCPPWANVSRATIFYRIECRHSEVGRDRA